MPKRRSPRAFWLLIALAVLGPPLISFALQSSPDLLRGIVQGIPEPQPVVIRPRLFVAYGALIAACTLAIGAGQMSRVDAVNVAIMKAQAASRSLTASVAASDAFFPFRDGLDAVARAGATAVVQPGGSVRDAEVIAAADEQGLARVFTGRRHFRH